jgi:hypothetical protein
MGFNNWKKEPEQEDNTDLLCSAHGCPMEWTVNFGSRLCTYHSSSSPRDWPSVTTGLHSRGLVGSLPTFAKRQAFEPPRSGKTLTKEEKLEVIKAMKVGVIVQPRDWAYKLKAREEAGECLSKIQRDAWRQVIR